MTSHAAIQHMMVRLLTPDDAAAYVSLRRQMLVESPWAFGASPESDSRSDVARVASSIGSPGVAYGGGFAAEALASVAVMIREESPSGRTSRASTACTRVRTCGAVGCAARC
jgi:hypothetical protein